MAGKRQHYIPRFLQRGFLAERTGDAERTWLHRRGTAARLVGIRDVGVGEFFYSKLPDAGENALDDLITSLECDIHTDLQGLQQAPRGDVVDSRIPARITTHLTLRTAHVRSIFQQGAAQLLDQISALTTDSDQLRELIGLDSVGMRPILDAIDEELKSSPLGGLLPRPFARRVTAFLLRESFNEVWTFQMPMVAETIAKLIKVLPTMARDGHNNALRTAKTTQWEANLAQLSWRTYSVVGAILPDCIALAQSGADPLTPLTLREHQIPDTIILPIAHDLLLVGSRGEPIEFEIDKINAASAACSDSFFIACSSYDSADLASLIGQRCSLAIKDAVAEAIAEARPCDSSQLAPDMALLASANHASSFSFSLACQGFADAETVTKLGEVMQIVVREMSLDLPLSQLDGVTFAADYAAALENLDRGDPTLQADKTRPRTLQIASQHRRHVQPCSAGLGALPRRQHHGHHHTRPSDAPLQTPRVRRQKLSPQGSSHQACCIRESRLIISSSCLGEFTRPQVGEFEVTIRAPTPSAAPTRARRVWMARTSWMSKRTGLSGGSANWRLRSERRLTDRTLSEECSSRRPMANCGRWASRPYGIGCA